eukprot:CAMPEP_0205910312 /NCGR_PEP_ID=MMETSP1325-20131115/4365_1 /ASSEMBLY_ACC=CAM_ASM_000708 /TAXON_ID=236786 /ORGANISM="Florenciella sp., Strain RCC1007" /LENGTH=54 /DNA_ID=CAMNT_0053276655 /DNA_START=263 /DNA_END=424 /DNA_ORIENTATION=-
MSVGPSASTRNARAIDCLASLRTRDTSGPLLVGHRSLLAWLAGSAVVGKGPGAA